MSSKSQFLGLMSPAYMTDIRPRSYSVDTLTQLIANLVAIDSVNPDLVPGGAGEGAVAHFIASWLDAAGLEVHLDEVLRGRPNVIDRVMLRLSGWRIS